MKKLSVTSIEDLVKASEGTLIELPSFSEGTPFVAKLRRPSMLALVKAGKIPNALLLTANKLFSSGTIDSEDSGAMENLFKILDALCDACFVEPSYQDIKKCWN